MFTQAESSANELSLDFVHFLDYIVHIDGHIKQESSFAESIFLSHSCPKVAELYHARSQFLTCMETQT